MTDEKDWNHAFFDAERGVRRVEIVLADEQNLETLVKTLQRLEQLRKKVADVLDEVHTKVYKALGPEKTAETAFGLIEKYVTSTTKWDDDLIFSSILTRVPTTVDPETGERRLDGDKAVEMLKSAASISYWRRGKLETMGIDPDQVSERRWGVKRVRIGRRKA